MKKYKRSTVIPIALLGYLAIMSYIGLPYYKAGDYFFYFGIIGATLIVLILLHLSLKRKERLRQQREQEINEDKSSGKSAE